MLQVQVPSQELLATPAVPHSVAQFGVKHPLRNHAQAQMSRTNVTVSDHFMVSLRLSICSRIYALFLHRFQQTHDVTVSCELIPQLLTLNI